MNSNRSINGTPNPQPYYFGYYSLLRRIISLAPASDGDPAALDG